MLPAAPIFNPGEAHAKLSRPKRCLGAPNVERSAKTYGSGKAPEHTLGDVKRRLLAVLTDGGSFVASNHHRIACDDNLHGLGLDTDEIDDDLEASRRFQHIESDLALSRVRRRLVPHELLE
jgi:hypothetical protein